MLSRARKLTFRLYIRGEGMTIVDIAKEAGYSVSTVSRVLNGRRDVSEEARDRIMRIVEAYQFVPNNNAKHLKQTVNAALILIRSGRS